jgi:hypothetical protein
MPTLHGSERMRVSGVLIARQLNVQALGCFARASSPMPFLDYYCRLTLVRDELRYERGVS